MSTNVVEVILIEDNEDDATLTMRALRKNHVANNIVHFKYGEDAIKYIFDEERLKSPAFKPKVILLDLKLPKVSGKEILAKLKSDPRTKYIPVVVLTSSSEDPDIHACYELGANAFIVKPVDADSFAKAVIDTGSYWMLMNVVPR